MLSDTDAAGDVLAVDSLSSFLETVRAEGNEAGKTSHSGNEWYLLKASVDEHSWMINPP